jgi:hypothetical protein
MKPYSHAFLTVEAGKTIEEDVDLDVDLNPVAVAAPPDPALSIMPPVSRPLLRDVYAEDAEFEITQPALIVNDRGRELPQNPGVIKGKIVWLYLPDRGSYLLSLAPLPDLGFTLAGEVGGSALKFQAGDEQVEVDSSNRILMGSATYNLYVRRSDWVPPRSADPVPLIGSADRADGLLK